MVEEADLGVPNRVDERLADDDATKRLVGAGHALGEGDHVGNDIEAFAASEVTQAAKGIDDFVGVQQDAVLVAQLAELLPVAIGRHNRAPAVLYWLRADHGNGFGALGQDHGFHCLDAGQVGCGAAFGDFVAAGVHDVAGAVPQHGLEVSFELWDARYGERSEGGAVIGPFPSDDLVPLSVALTQVVVASELDRGLDRFGTAADEEHFVQIAGSALGDHGCRFDSGWVREAPDWEEGQLLHLLHCRGSKIGPAVAHIGAEQPGKTVEVLVAVGIPDVTAFAPINHRVIVGGPRRAFRKVRHQVSLGLCLFACGNSHDSPSGKRGPICSR